MGNSVSKVTEEAKKMVRHYVGMDNPQIWMFGETYHVEGERDEIEELAQKYLDLKAKAELADSLAEQVRLLTEQRDAVVVECLSLKSAIIDLEDKYMNWEGLCDAFAAAKATPTPATDKATAALRAEAIRFAAYHLPDNGKYQESILVLADEVEDEVTEVKLPFARQLRESKGEAL